MPRIHRPKALCAACVLALSLSALADPSIGESLSVSAGKTQTIAQTTTLARLTLGDKAALVAPVGHSLSLTVDGVGMPMLPGTYRGHVVLSVTEDIPVAFGDRKDPYLYRAAVYIDGGAKVPARSVSAMTGKESRITDTQADHVSIDSREENVNGIIVAGDSRYTINQPTIQMTGNGGNDFAGYGAAIMTTGKAKVTVNKARITTQGAVRTAFFIGGDSTLTVNDSFVEVKNGQLPPDYKFSIRPGEMREVPYGLGITGNVRATNLMDHGTVYYNHDHIRAQGWGALSSDGDGPTYMYATDTLIETIDSGYGAYANGHAHDHFSHCTFKVVDVGLIIGGPGSGTFTDGSVVNSGRYGVMMHQGTGGGTLTIEKGSVFNTGSTLIEVKGRGTHIVVDDASLHPGNGVILQGMDNDDPIMVEMAKHPGALPGPPAGTPTFSGDIVADFHRVHLHGDLLNGMTDVGDMIITLQDATVEGAISTSTTSPCSGKPPTRETLHDIGCVANALGSNTGPHGARLSLDGTSRWVVDKTSYLNELTLAPGAVVSGAQGQPLTLLVNGVKTPLKPGSYKGKLVIKLS
ncbi:hypothetical protein [Dyella sp. C9]|uniref:hypothetical protein n=1 Tax=Dyella sp. C9 TaxID=2202154 RepID=UPI001300BD55|nr:hypothetical protein [Dyella sp. C9]